ncbi:MAG: histidine kinase [Clostridia bacterium]|nr:histidine kinase [Clostridia bacterium]
MTKQTQVLEEVISETLLAIENSKNQICDIVENTRSEKERVERELEEIQKEVVITIDNVDVLEQKEKIARLRLMEVSRQFEKYSEKEVHKIYDAAMEYQVELGSLREREKQLKLRRNELELSLKRLQATMGKAEGLITQVGVVFDYLGGNLKTINDQLEVVMQRRQLAPRIIQAQEEERRRVAREIHDGPAQSMANVVLRTEVCEKLLDLDRGEIRKELSELREMVKKSLQDVRRIIFDLRPMTLDDLGLIPAISRYVENIKERYDINVDIKCVGQQRRLDSILEVAIYRIIQESLQNTTKHAKSKNISIQLTIESQRIVVRINDDGKGFDATECIKNPKSGSYGIMGMKERLDILGGQLYIDSKIGEGTEVLAIVPLDG